MPFESGDIVLVQFPFTDQSTTKKRPAVVISAGDADSPDVIIMAVTSQSAAVRSGLEIDEWQQAGLLKPSLVKPVVATLHRRLVLKTLGRLSERDLAKLRHFLRALFLI